jgi:hypothetical protein
MELSYGYRVAGRQHCNDRTFHFRTMEIRRRCFDTTRCTFKAIYLDWSSDTLLFGISNLLGKSELHSSAITTNTVRRILSSCPFTSKLFMT